MANKKTVELLLTWQDVAGGSKVFSCSVERSETGSNLDLAAITTKAQAIVAAIDALSDCKFISASIVVPIAAQITGGKANADADSRSRRHAVASFICESGENLRQENISMQVPDPKDAKLEVVNGRQVLKVGDTDVAAFRDAVIAQCLTVGGEQATSYAGSYVRQRPTAAGSRQ